MTDKKTGSGKGGETPPYVGLARRYRPQTFGEVVGQDPIVQTLRQAIRTGKVAHAYLLAGPRGTGKTTVARILARCLNCKQGIVDEPCGSCESCRLAAQGGDMDVLEIDGASNRRIDEVREIRAQASYAAARGGHRIYIVDEVHMLTNEAFNALLKILEEPPAHVKFILATTHPHKVPLTVRSRCQRFDFRRIPCGTIVKELAQVARREGIRAASDALERIALYAEGGMRDALVLLEQAASIGGEVTAAWVDEVSGRVDRSRIEAFLGFASRGDLAGALREVARFWEEGTDLPWVVEGCLAYLAEILRADAPGAPFPFPVALRWLDLLEQSRKGMGSDLAGRIRLELALARGISLPAAASAAAPVPAEGARPPASVAPAARTPVPPAPAPTLSAPARAGSAAPVEPPREAPKRHAPPPAPAAAEAPTTPPVSAAVCGSGAGPSLEAILARWPEMVIAVTKAKPSVGALLREALPVSCKAGILVLGIPVEFKFHRDQLGSPGRRKFLDEVFGKVLGEAVSVRIGEREAGAIAPSGEAPEEERGDGDGPSGPPPEGTEPEGGASADPSPAEQTGPLPEIVRRAKEIFGGRVV